MTEVRVRVEHEVGRPIPDYRWDALVDGGFLAIDESLPVGDGIQNAAREMARAYWHFYGAEIAGNASREETTEPGGMDPATVKRTRVLADLYAARAAADPEVLAFRRDVLGGKLLAADENVDVIAKWISEVEPLSSWKWIAHLLSARFPLDRTDLNRYAPPSEMPDVLRRLDMLTEDLGHRFDWMKGKAAHFVLTGRKPEVHAFRAWAQFVYDNPPASRLSLTIDPTTTPNEVKRVYQILRKNFFFGDRIVRLPTDKAVDLAAFSLTARDDEQTADLVRRWNEEHSQDAYDPDDPTAVGNFRRDLKSAVERVLSPPIRER